MSRGGRSTTFAASALILSLSAGVARAGPDRGALVGNPARGLWAGALHLCRDTVADIVLGSDYGGRPSLTIILNPAASEVLRRETERRVESELPVTLNGRVVIRPVVREPISGGVILLIGPSHKELKAVRRAARKYC